MRIPSARKLLAAAGLAAALLASLSYLLLYGALGVVVDLRWVVLTTSAVGLVFLIAERNLYHEEAGGVSRLAKDIVLVLSFLLLLRGGYECFYAYEAREVTFRSGDIRLSGTLYLPPGGEGVPAVVLVHGSGPESRKEYAFYARLLARNGIAALAYDKRGVGRSEGSTYATGYGGYAEDAAAAVRFLQDRPSVDRSRVGFWGFSEAEWVAPLAASKLDTVAFLVVVSASGWSPHRQVTYEIRSTLERRGFDESVIDTALDVQRLLGKYLRRGEDEGDSLLHAITRRRHRPWYGPAELPAERYAVEEYGWWRQVMDFPALEAWRRVSCPVLLVSGGEDLNSPVGESHRRIGEVLRSAGNRDVSGIIYPGADHHILEWRLPGGMPPPFFPEGYPVEVVQWIREQTGDRGM